MIKQLNLLLVILISLPIRSQGEELVESLVTKEERIKIVEDIKSVMNLYCMSKEGSEIGLSGGERPIDTDFNFFIDNGFFQKDFELYQKGFCDFVITRRLLEIYEGQIELDVKIKKSLIEKIEQFDSSDSIFIQDKILKEIMSLEDSRKIMNEISAIPNSENLMFVSETNKKLEIKEGTYLKITKDVIEIGRYGLSRYADRKGIIYDSRFFPRYIPKDISRFLFKYLGLFQYEKVGKIGNWAYYPLNNQKVFSSYKCAREVTLYYENCSDLAEFYSCDFNVESKNIPSNATSLKKINCSKSYRSKSTIFDGR